MPAGSEPGSRGTVEPPALPVRFRPTGVRVATVAFAAVLVGTIAVVWLALSAEARDSFTLPQRVTVVGMVLGVLAIGHALARCRVDADDAGLTLVNGYRTYRLAWEEVVAVALRPGSPWAVLDLDDGTTRSAMGIQGSDGHRAVRQTKQLRALVEAHAAVDPPGH